MVFFKGRCPFAADWQVETFVANCATAREHGSAFGSMLKEPNWLQQMVNVWLRWGYEDQAKEHGKQ